MAGPAPRHDRPRSAPALTRSRSLSSCCSRGVGGGASAFFFIATPGVFSLFDTSMKGTRCAAVIMIEAEGGKEGERELERGLPLTFLSGTSLSVGNSWYSRSYFPGPARWMAGEIRIDQSSASTAVMGGAKLTLIIRKGRSCVVKNQTLCRAS